MQDIGAVEVVSLGLEGLAPAAAPQRLAGLEARLADVRFALETIRTYDSEKTSFLEPKPLISRSDLADVSQHNEEADEITDKIKKLADSMSALKTRRQRLKNKINQLMPFIDFDIPLQTLGESTVTTSLMGSIPDENAPKYRQLVVDYADTAYFERSSRGKDSFTVYVIMHKSVQEQLTGELKFIGFAEAPAKDNVGTAADIVYDCKNEYDSLEHEAREYEETAVRYAEHKELLFILEDYLLTEIARERCIEKLGESGTVFALEGWVIAQEQQRVEHAVLSAAPEAYVTFSDPSQEEKPPTALLNPRSVSPFEAVTNMYAVPSSRGIDPNKLVAVFYFIIFGMMMADFAYGIILSVGAFLMLRLKKPTGMFKKITTVILICGISTAIWGLFYGTVFSIEGVPYVLNPLADSQSAMLTLMLCLGIGVLHIFTGLFVGMYMDIKRGKVFAAFCDRFTWVLVIGGGVMLLIGGSIGTVGTYLALVGAAVLLLTQGRHKKGILKKQ